jgi:hypothetical protein
VCGRAKRTHVHDIATMVAIWGPRDGGERARDGFGGGLKVGGLAYLNPTGSNNNGQGWRQNARRRAISRPAKRRLTAEFTSPSAKSRRCGRGVGLVNRSRGSDFKALGGDGIEASSGRGIPTRIEIIDRHWTPSLRLQPETPGKAPRNRRFSMCLDIKAHQTSGLYIRFRPVTH